MRLVHEGSCLLLSQEQNADSNTRDRANVLQARNRLKLHHLYAGQTSLGTMMNRATVHSTAGDILTRARTERTVAAGAEENHLTPQPQLIKFITESHLFAPQLR